MIAESKSIHQFILELFFGWFPGFQWIWPSGLFDLGPRDTWTITKYFRVKKSQAISRISRRATTIHGCSSVIQDSRIRIFGFPLDFCRISLLLIRPTHHHQEPHDQHPPPRCGCHSQAPPPSRVANSRATKSRNHHGITIVYYSHKELCS